jgi:hypothetical protein
MKTVRIGNNFITFWSFKKEAAPHRPFSLKFLLF